MNVITGIDFTTGVYAVLLLIQHTNARGKLWFITLPEALLRFLLRVRVSPTAVPPQPPLRPTVKEASGNQI